MKSLITFLLCWSLPFLAFGGPIQSHHAAVAKRKAAPGGGGGPTLVISTHDQGGENGATTPNVDTTGANLIVVSVSWYSLANDVTMADSEGNTWTGLTAQNATGDSKNRLFYCYNPTTDAAQAFFVTGSATYPSMQVAAFSGIAASPFDQENGSNNGSSATLSTGSITPSQANTLAIAGVSFQDNSAGAVSIDNGFTIIHTDAYVGGASLGGSLAYKVLTSTSAQNPQWDIGSASSISATIANFKY